ncbi:uncharacterized protein J4E92_001741 [Alternaria infectoria]|uniref:uncharacterized protein n=1 Tax=Alternaria infectoria TaxID=45303 RepID=UPI00222112E5|nr:uncharacterized protein J4E92_001741 [Alternaria infectoria]KAI4937016.1 hypothetical protein J4E92_001741 [Alternaria infectoria]
MQFTTTIALLIAAVSVNAAPTEMSKRLDTIPLKFYSGPGCNSGIAVTTAYIPADGSCFPTSPIFSGNTDSALILPTDLPALPAGCTLVAYSDNTCSSVNSIVYDVTGRCGTFGPNKPIFSARAVGTCQ